MVIDDDDIETTRLRFGKGSGTCCAAIDADEQSGAALGKRAHGLDVWAVAFEQAVGNMNNRLDAAVAKKTGKQRRRSRTVHIVVAEDRDTFSAHRCIRDPFRRLLHGREHKWIGHRALDGRIEKSVDRIGLDIAAGDDPSQELGQRVMLRDSQRPRSAAFVEPVAPGATRRRVFDAEE